ncbi:MAG TPA: GNAT family N-acetyltransferase [Jatrophihabitans sp.]
MGRLFVVMVRLREPEDVRLCVEVLAGVHDQDGYPLQWPADPVSWLSPPGLVSAWVADVDGELAGHVALIGDNSSELPPGLGQAEISRLFVSPTMRGRGVGAQLLDAVTRRAEHQGWALWLEVVEGRGSAAPFYERRGWRLVDRRSADWTTSAGDRPVLRRYAEPSQPKYP